MGAVAYWALWTLVQPQTGFAIICGLAAASLICGVALIMRSLDFYRD